MELENESSPAIEFRGVSLSYDEKPILTDINFRLERGEMLFITGEAGSGKSVLLRLAMALEHPDAGHVLIEGRDVSALSETELLEIRGSRMGIVFQEDSLFTGLTVFDNVAYRLDEHRVDEVETEKSVMEVLSFVGLDRDADRLPEELSGGMRRRLEIARALIGWPSIMLFDEPASGLDPLTAIQVLDLIVRARDIYGISSIYVTKKLDEIPYLATHRARKAGAHVIVEDPDLVGGAPPAKLIVLDAGRIVFSGSVKEFEHSSLPSVMRLTHAGDRPAAGFSPPDPWDRRRRPRELIL